MGTHVVPFSNLTGTPCDFARLTFIIWAAGWLIDNGIKFDQCIDEQVKGERWLHIAVRDNNGRQRCQNLLIQV
jgi:hypothetical protein